MDDSVAVMLDIGSFNIKAGFAGEDAPKVVIPTILGRPKHPGVLVGMDQKDFYVGAEAISKKHLLTLTTPVADGKILDYDDLEHILTEMMNNELKSGFEDQKVMVSEPPNTTLETRTQLAELFFDQFEVRSLYFANQPVLSLYASARTTGTVVDCGHSVTYCVPIYEGYAIPHAILTMPIGGKALNEFMFSMLSKPGIMDKIEDDSFVFDIDVARQIKENNCIVAQDFDAEMKAASEQKTFERRYTLPGSTQEITLSTQLLKCPEMLFQPSVQGSKDLDGIHKYTFDAIMKCDTEIRRTLFKNIVLAGGTTAIEGMRERMKKEIQALAPSPMGPEVEAPADRKFSQWLGGSILSNLESFNHMWITKEQYKQHGSAIIYRNCF
ncbi:UNKNOWN [Stylonychia lemnae]|uniref:Actin n=1 Tax=Stylonychia lemnae TaxID=5949 RepID=A0A078AYB5_STYLE|nr:UNKNOWN [Stylonychia lemnae]|eukprot:CDW85788.1 UNKNOWN [Stylonychia lemnae]